MGIDLDGTDYHNGGLGDELFDSDESGSTPDGVFRSQVWGPLVLLFLHAPFPPLRLQCC